MRLFAKNHMRTDSTTAAPYVLVYTPQHIIGRAYFLDEDNESFGWWDLLPMSSYRGHMTPWLPACDPEYGLPAWQACEGWTFMASHRVPLPELYDFAQGVLGEPVLLESYYTQTGAHWDDIRLSVPVHFITPLAGA